MYTNACNATVTNKATLNCYYIHKHPACVEYRFNSENVKAGWLRSVSRCSAARSWVQGLRGWGVLKRTRVEKNLAGLNDGFTGE